MKKFLFYLFINHIIFLNSYSQPYQKVPLINPFGLPAASSHNRLAFGDLDNDGDLDIIGLDEYGLNAPFLYFKNIGSAGKPSFAAPEKNPFNLSPLSFLNMIYLIDFDGDKDLDLFAGGESGYFYFENKGIEAGFSSPVLNPFGLTPPVGSNTLIPTFGDLDNDGDKDLLVGDFNGRLFYYKNSGSANSPLYEMPISNPFGYQRPSSNAVFLAPVLEDANKDGLLDLWVGYNPGFIKLFTNLGTPKEPSFGSAEGNPQGLSFSSFNIWAMPIFADIDDDGDRDMFVTSFPNIFFHENITASVTSTWDLQKQEGLSALSIYPNPSKDATILNFSLEKSCDLIIRLIDINGQVLQIISENNFFSGKHDIRIDTKYLPSGLYFVYISVNGIPRGFPISVQR